MNFNTPLIPSVARYTKIHLYCLVLALLSACVGDEDGYIVDNPDLSSERLLTGLVFISPERDTQFAQISEAVPVTEVFQRVSIQTAIVATKEIGTSSAPQVFTFNKDKDYYTGAFSVSEGKEYALSVEYGSKTLKGTCKVPQQVSSVDLIQLYVQDIDEYGIEWGAKIHIQDNQEEENSYHLLVSVLESGPLHSRTDSIRFVRIALTNWADVDVLIKDRGREGQVLQEDVKLSYFDGLETLSEKLDDPKIDVQIEITVITADYNYHRYYQSIHNEFGGDGGEDIESDAGGADGARGIGGDEPILFPVELEGSVGIFIAYRVSYHKFDLRDFNLKEILGKATTRPE